MTRDAVNLKIVAERLEHVSRCLDDLRELPATTLKDFLADRRNAPAADSLLRHAIEALFDTARHLLAKAYGLGQLEYRQVAETSAAKGIVTDSELAARFEKIAGFRNRLIHYYEEVTPEELYGIIRNDLGDLEALAAELRNSARRLAGDETSD